MAPWVCNTSCGSRVNPIMITCSWEVTCNLVNFLYQPWNVISWYFVHNCVMNFKFNSNMINGIFEEALFYNWWVVTEGITVNLYCIYLMLCIFTRMLEQNVNTAKLRTSVFTKVSKSTYFYHQLNYRFNRISLTLQQLGIFWSTIRCVNHEWVTHAVIFIIFRQKL